MAVAVALGLSGGCPGTGSGWSWLVKGWGGLELAGQPCPHVAPHVVCSVSWLGFLTTWWPQAPHLAALGSKTPSESEVPQSRYLLQGPRL